MCNFALIDVPVGLDTDRRVDWVTRRVADTGVGVTR
jgi:hypothetical protein